LCATLGGRSVDTTMGWTPLEGLVMATRSGTVDPGLVLWLIQQGGLPVDEIARALESESGLAALSGIAGGDMRDVLAARAVGDEAATLAFDVYVHRLRRELGGMIAVLGGIDVLVFTGGVGEHVADVRSAASEISAAGKEIRTLVVPAREDLEIARQVRGLL
jgi:acetate kinase